MWRHGKKTKGIDIMLNVTKYGITMKKKKYKNYLGLISLCPKCHQVKHFGRTSAIGKQAEAFKHMEKVNNWNHKQCLDHLKVAMSEWRERSKYQWFIDLSYLNEKYEIPKKLINEAEKKRK